MNAKYSSVFYVSLHKALPAVGLYELALAGYPPRRYAAHRLEILSLMESQPDVAQCLVMGFTSGQGASDKERYLWLRMTRSFGK